MKQKKNEKIVHQKNEKTSRNQALQQNSHQSYEQLDISFCEIFMTILKMDKEETQTNIPKDKKILMASHPRVDIERLYVSRKWGLGLASREHCIDASKRKAGDNIKTIKERLTTAKLQQGQHKYW